MINVAGLGVAGSYLLRRLNQEGFDSLGFDPKRPDYYIPCGYATNLDRIKIFASRAGLDMEEYCLVRSSSVTFSGNEFGPVEFAGRRIGTFDKNRFERDLVVGLPTKMAALRQAGNGSVTIDATGVSRQILGKTEDDHLMYTREIISKKADHKDFYFHFFKNGTGYYWEFPIAGGYHIGAGALTLDMVDEALRSVQPGLTIGRKIRMKPLFENMVRDNVIGVGESIGLVSPITGEGIMPALESAEVLIQIMKRQDDLDTIKMAYRKQIMKAYGYYEQLYNLVSAIQNGRTLGFSALHTSLLARKDLIGFGIDFSIRKVIRHFL
ncbi:MAG: NAD(P)/FAD-dependent oxidoreductase [Thermoplasmataceae archaeon]